MINDNRLMTTERRTVCFSNYGTDSTRTVVYTAIQLWQQTDSSFSATNFHISSYCLDASSVRHAFRIAGAVMISQNVKKKLSQRAFRLVPTLQSAAVSKPLSIFRRILFVL
jgi:hypothetical protein